MACNFCNGVPTVIYENEGEEWALSVERHDMYADLKIDVYYDIGFSGTSIDIIFCPMCGEWLGGSAEDVIDEV
ncbi:MAG TPA: hypothetical protein GXX70_09395 [Tepidimicrobium sp.]|nr:hypothetical protein [Tepidimicrobium sp.]